MALSVVDFIHVEDNPARTVALPGAMSTGDVTVRVVDPLGFCDGTWQLTVRGGRGTAKRTDLEAGVSVGVDALASMWLGDRTAETLALAGRVTGGPEAIRTLSRVLATDLPPVNLAHF